MAPASGDDLAVRLDDDTARDVVVGAVLGGAEGRHDDAGVAEVGVGHAARVVAHDGDVAIRSVVDVAYQHDLAVALQRDVVRVLARPAPLASVTTVPSPAHVASGAPLASSRSRDLARRTTASDHDGTLRRIEDQPADAIVAAEVDDALAGDAEGRVGHAVRVEPRDQEVAAATAERRGRDEQRAVRAPHETDRPGAIAPRSGLTMPPVPKVGSSVPSSP